MRLGGIAVAGLQLGSEAISAAYLGEEPIFTAAAPLLAETEAILAAFSVPPDAARQGVMNQTVAALKTAGVWDKLDLLYVLAAHDEQAGRVNWIAPASQTLTAIGGPQFDADEGFTGNGTSAYLTPGIGYGDLTKYALDNASIFSHALSNMSGTNMYDIGVSGSFNIGVASRFGNGNLTGRVNGGSASAVAVASSHGLSGFARPDGANVVAVKPSEDIYSSSGVSSSEVPEGDIAILHGGSNYSTRQIAAAGAGAHLSEAEFGALDAALGTYLVAVGAL